MLLRGNPNLTIYDFNVKTAWDYVIEQNNIVGMKMLLNNGANPNIKISNGDTLLHWAIQFNQEELFTLLLSKKAKINEQNNEGKTPLHIAIEKRNLHLIKLLLDNGSDMGVCDQNGLSGWDYVVAHNSSFFIQQMLDMNVNPNIKNDFGNAILHWAVQQNDPKIVKALLDANADPNMQNNDGQTPLHLCASSQQKRVMEIIMMLLGANADVNIKNNDELTPLYFAVESNNCRIARFLLVQDNNLPLSIYTHIHTGEMIDTFAKAGIDLVSLKDEQGKSLFFYTSERSVLERLVFCGVDINAQDRNGETALFDAVRNLELEKIDALCDLGLDPKIKRIDGKKAADMTWHKGVLTFLGEKEKAFDLRTTNEPESEDLFEKSIQDRMEKMVSSVMDKVEKSMETAATIMAGAAATSVAVTQQQTRSEWSGMRQATGHIVDVSAIDVQKPQKITPHNGKRSQKFSNTGRDMTQQ